MLPIAADAADADLDASARTGLGSLVHTCSTEYRRLLSEPQCRESVLHFVRTMRAANAGAVCPLQRAIGPVLNAMGDMDCRDTLTLVLDGDSIPALLQGVIQSSSHCFNFQRSTLTRDGGIQSYFSCMYFEAGDAPNADCLCSGVTKCASTSDNTAEAATSEVSAAAFPPTIPAAAPVAGRKRRAVHATNNSDQGSGASSASSHGPGATSQAQRVRRALEKRVDPRPCRCSVRGCTGRLTFLHYPGFRLAVIRRTPHSTHSSSSPGAAARDSNALPLHPATMIYGMQLFNSKGKAPTNTADIMQVCKVLKDEQ